MPTSLPAPEQKNTDYYLYGGWLEGYFSAYNQFQQDNYDISPWQTTELLLLLLQRHCKDNPTAKYLDAANAMIKAFYPIRLTAESKIIKIEVGEVSSYFYQEILLRAKQRLKFLGYYDGEPNGTTYTDDDTKAFSDYQRKVGLRITGIPDQRTLTNLFLKATQ